MSLDNLLETMRTKRFTGIDTRAEGPYSHIAITFRKGIQCAKET